MQSFRGPLYFDCTDDEDTSPQGISRGRTRAAVLAGHGLGALAEALEQLRLGLGADADPRVAHRDVHQLPRLPVARLVAPAVGTRVCACSVVGMPETYTTLTITRD